MYVCMCVYVCMYVCVYVCVCMYVCMYVLCLSPYECDRASELSHFRVTILLIAQRFNILLHTMQNLISNLKCYEAYVCAYV